MGGKFVPIGVTDVSRLGRETFELLDNIVSLSHEKIIILTTSFIGESCARVRSSQSILHHQEQPPSG